MITSDTAIRMARSLIGTSYETLDCINLIKKIIRTSAGGDKRYTTAGTNALWDSDGKRGRYRDLTWKQAGISGAKPGMLAFMGVGTGDVNHVGLVTERGTIIHSSKSRGGGSLGGGIALFALNFIIGGVIGGFVLAWRLIVAVWYVPLTVYRLIVG